MSGLNISLSEGEYAAIQKIIWKTRKMIGNDKAFWNKQKCKSFHCLVSSKTVGLGKE